MLDLDLDLEADLGVDTVKQAEMFAAVRTAYNIPRDETLKLRDFPTLAHVIKFARERTGKATSASRLRRSHSVKLFHRFRLSLRRHVLWRPVSMRRIGFHGGFLCPCCVHHWPFASRPESSWGLVVV